MRAGWRSVKRRASTPPINSPTTCARSIRRPARRAARSSARSSKVKGSRGRGSAVAAHVVAHDVEVSGKGVDLRMPHPEVAGEPVHQHNRRPARGAAVVHAVQSMRMAISFTALPQYAASCCQRCAVSAGEVPSGTTPSLAKRSCAAGERRASRNSR